MRSIVVVFAVALAACGPFGERSDTSESGESDPDVPVKKKASSVDDPVDSTSSGGAITPGPVEEATDDRFKSVFPGSKLFKPATTPAPGIIVLHGSAGGQDPVYVALARQLAANGFVTMALCWSGCGDTAPATPLPGDGTDLTRIAAAGEFIRDPSASTTGKIGVFGLDDGAEAALVLTATLESSGVNQPFGSVASYPSPSVAHRSWAIGTLFISPGSAIPVTRISAPILVMHGMSDNQWPLAEARSIVSMREDSSSPLFTDEHFFPDQGHVLDRQSAKDELAQRVTDWFRTTLR